MKEVPSSQAHLLQELSHHAPSKMNADFGVCLGRSAVGISLLGGYWFIMRSLRVGDWVKNLMFLWCERLNFGIIL